MIKVMTREELEIMPDLDRMITEGDCRWMTSIGASTRYYMIKMGRFPPRYEYGPKTKLYRLSEVQAWVRDKDKTTPTAHWRNALKVLWLVPGLPTRN
ncbi:AlpA family transcriptional regulator [Erwinia tracheiphila]|uniref:AlpA family phage regulatory protein n=1 Tax=Erwinia tracheiphila TaxID=65700 RepID=A0A0M2K5R8_9GAMM|nr:AlpA family phage regulatory protein [Erwinia tracheiphila]KKF34304.1 hypothetical protein SY86_25415 [Erwinia tracheiphila]UIA89337.1 AlpA family transcriptional regulator [Erwinia tracheiphila]UIA97720.1 AlpA family transcriptional regulator [Erwinia tracheiphila]